MASRGCEEAGPPARRRPRKRPERRRKRRRKRRRRQRRMGGCPRPIRREGTWMCRAVPRAERRRRNGDGEGWGDRGRSDGHPTPTSTEAGDSRFPHTTIPATRSLSSLSCPGSRCSHHAAGAHQSHISQKRQRPDCPGGALRGEGRGDRRCSLSTTARRGRGIRFRRLHKTRTHLGSHVDLPREDDALARKGQRASRGPAPSTPTTPSEHPRREREGLPERYGMVRRPPRPRAGCSPPTCRRGGRQR